MTTFVDLDVRPILLNGGEPFSAIMQAVASLKPGEGLRLIATFQPVPLFRVMADKGFSHEARPLEDGSWEVLFHPLETAAGLAGGGDGAAWPEPARHLDNRDLEPPEPMMRILAATEEMQAGEVLSALLCREPVFLLPELEKRGLAWRGDFEPDGQTYRMLIRIGAKTAKSD